MSLCKPPRPSIPLRLDREGKSRRVINQRIRSDTEFDTRREDAGFLKIDGQQPTWWAFVVHKLHESPRPTSFN